MRLRVSIASSVLALIAFAASAHAQGFNAITSSDGTDVWAVGDAGAIYRSLSGGADWTNTTLGNRTLRAVAARGFNVVVAGDSGKIWRSQNSGGAWALTVVAGAPDLRAIAMPTDLVVYIVGAAGTIRKSVDGGGVWAPQVSGTAQTLNAVRFTDALHGWAVGNGGVVLKTSDAGAHWSVVSAATTAALLGVDVSGSTVWIVGVNGTARRSSNDGASWQGVNLKLDAKADVRSVWLESPDVVTLVGGGGFIRKSVDGGRIWDYPVHPLQAPISSIYFAGGKGWVCSDRTRAILASVDYGVTWTLPVTTIVTRTWEQKLSFAGNVRGSSIALNPFAKNTLYAALGNTVYRSRDDGDTWTSISAIPQCTKVNAFVVSPKDSNVFVAAVSGIIQKRMVKSDDNGQSWFTTLSHDFGEYGIPIEVDPDHPDTMFFGADGDKLFRSTDAGKNWYRWSSNTFRSPCDIICVPDTTGIILLGDGITGSGNAQFFKSIDGGQNFTVMSTRPDGASEIPGMACARLRNNVAFGSNWSIGGIQRTTDYGATWPTINPVGSAWGIDISRDDPNCVMFGVYAGAFTYLSLDGGLTTTALSLLSSNYSFYARDRATILAEQANGLWKLKIDYQTFPNNTQALTVTAPNGGELWGPATTHDVSWLAQNVAMARIEYRKSPGDPWQFVANVPGYAQRYAWTLPSDATTTAKIRILDTADSSPTDSSNGTFAIGASAAVGDAPVAAFTLWQNQPNPFSRATRIGYSLPKRSPVRLDVFNLLGERVATLVHESQEAGVYNVDFGAGARTARGERLGSLDAGVYFYRFQAGSFTSTRKMLLLK